ncbi:TPA: MarR family transcriptional regulator [Escherichia coli]|jgi:hypothetical protein|uniref:MarR family transcriptional regulator n=1 Tax=Bacillaceae TaxID=186817 RepID=UPI0008640D5C|nr:MULTISPECIES: MarR family transcriptional regulator [Bacillus cereus group]MCU5059650.1 MarR family transcriptional regulator [Bacillus cereus]HBE2401885.1 MarR family transcriptional regulator [Escherichia coli]MCU5204058.1 MarR family transcriptional regulator [Bacillus paranthracis]MCU5214939.1 MarR family transcriptional regulator [Bacillus paranthracis]MDA2147068.1 MarR family transcriptional regulator [Bacillus cereus group sp. Bc248]
MTKIVNFDQAEKKARKRDFDLEKLQYALDHGGVPQEFIENAMELLSKATGKELYIGTKRSPQSKVRFAQFLQNNWEFLRQSKYLSAREKSFFIDITPLIAFSSNCIVDDIKAKNPAPLNISQIASYLGNERANISRIINSLVKKGLLFKGESGVEGNNSKAFAVFVNPHVIFAGDKDNVNEALQVMFHKAMKMPVLKDLPDKLF